MHSDPHMKWLRRAKSTSVSGRDNSITPGAVAVMVSLLLTPVIATAGEQPAEQRQQSSARTVVVSGRVGHIHSARLFALDETSVTSKNRLVVVPNINALPALGSLVVVGGVLRSIDQAGVAPDERGDASVDQETVVIAARSVVIGDGSDLIRRGPEGPSLSSLVAPRLAASITGRLAAQPGPAVVNRASETTVRATTLANMIDEIAGQDVRVMSARVVGMINPQVFLIEPAATFPPAARFQMPLGTRDRIAVLLARNTALRADPSTLVGSNVNVVGVARTPLGLRVSREVPWPRELTDEYMERLEVRAAVLATSVLSTDGIELTSAGTASQR